MILYYAVGGGLGHLTRARAVAHTFQLSDTIAVLTASPFAGDRRVMGDFTVARVPMEVAGDRSTYRAWLRKALVQLQPEAIYLDTFPAGILGELCDFPLPDVPLYHVGRLLRWGEYQEQLAGAAPTFQASYCVEGLAAEHQAFLQSRSLQVLPLEVQDPPPPSDEALRWVVRSLTGEGRPLWVVVHSGPATEIAELCAYAEEMSLAEGLHPRLLVISPQRPSGLSEEIAHLDLYPAEVVFPYVDRIISACGFNLMRQTRPYRSKHRFVPFERRFDDQFLRAARRRKELSSDGCA